MFDFSNKVNNILPLESPLFQFICVINSYHYVQFNSSEHVFPAAGNIQDNSHKLLNIQF